MSSHDMKPEEPAPLDAGVGQYEERQQAGDSSGPVGAPTPIDVWLESSMRNMRRMTVDEEYRRSIARHLS